MVSRSDNTICKAKKFEKLRDESYKIPPTKCVICNGSTSFYHYGISACNGCKQFFRRVIVSGKVYKCRSIPGRCNINGRNKCKYCRFFKCLELGMDPKSIKNITESSNIHDLTTKALCLKNSHSSFQEGIIIPRQLSTETIDSVTKILHHLCNLENKFKNIRESSYNPSELFSEDINYWLCKKSVFSENMSYKKPSNWPLTTIPFKHNILNCSIEEYEEEHKNFKFPFKSWRPFDLCLIIDYLKTQPFFHNLNREEQKCLFMNTGLAVRLLIDSYYAYEKNFPYIVYPDGFCPILFHEKPQPLEIDVHVNSLKPIKRLQLRKEEFCLLKIILFLSGNFSSFTESSLEVIRIEKEFYSSTLLSFLQKEYGDIKGAARFTEIMMLIQSIFMTVEKVKELYLLVNFAKSRVKKDLSLNYGKPILDIFCK
uniref:Nuclear receptor domain-containing protein n=1 Tax=Parastrongyloides trichosuri TaxID=131310 RepID=A0A0N4Z7Q0_PARTI